jgi:hypothetical protein
MSSLRSLQYLRPGTLLRQSPIRVQGGPPRRGQLRGLTRLALPVRLVPLFPDRREQLRVRSPASLGNGELRAVHRQARPTRQGCRGFEQRLGYRRVQ